MVATTNGLRSLMPGPGTTAGVDGGAISGINEIIDGSLQGVSLANGTITGTQIAANTITSANVAANLIQTISVTPTNANFVTAYTLGLVAVPAVTGKTIVPISALLRYVYGVHAFTSGGAVQLQWDTTLHAGGTTPLTTVAASVLQATASSDTMMQQLGTSSVTAGQGKALCIANATNNFAIAAGNTSSVTFIIQYVVV